MSELASTGIQECYKKSRAEQMHQTVSKSAYVADP